MRRAPLLTLSAAGNLLGSSVLKTHVRYASDAVEHASRSIFASACFYAADAQKGTLGFFCAELTSRFPRRSGLIEVPPSIKRATARRRKSGEMYRVAAPVKKIYNRPNFIWTVI